MKNIAVILAGGKGSRFGAQLPKQFIKINNKTVLEYSITAFQKNLGIDEIIVVSNPDYITETEKIAKQTYFTKVKAVLPGGKERYHSSLAAINYQKEEANLILHDAVRPLISDTVISKVTEALRNHKAVNVAVPTSDTILKADKTSGFIAEIPDRTVLFQSQTPQAFRLSVIKKAYRIGLKQANFKTTDDSGVVRNYLPEIDIFIVQGEHYNIKLTYPEDRFFVEFMLQ